MRRLKYLLMLATVLLLVTSCLKEPVREPFFEDNELNITAYLEQHIDDYSMFLELLQISGFKSAFNAYGHYTLFVFTNEVCQDYLEQKGYNQVADMTIEEARVLVRYHALGSEVSSSLLGYGKLPVKNLEEDELVSSFDETGLQGIIINRESRILTRDIELSNGIIHVLDKTLDPIIQSVVERLEEMGNYSIFLELVQQTGFYPILNQIYDTLDNGELRRVYFTVFSENDSVFNVRDIASFSDLELAYDNGYTDHTNPADSLNKFMANHLIGEKALFTKDFASGNYQSYYGELINFIVDQDYRINTSGPPEDRVFTTFLPAYSDFQTKNGVIHTLDKLFDIFNPEPVEVIWGFYDQPFARDLGRVNGQDSEHYPNLDLFPNMTGTISDVFIHIPYSDYGYIDNTSLTFGTPDFDVKILMPIKIVKGRYKFYLSAKDGGGRATIQVFINDLPVGEPINLNGEGRWYVYEHFVGEVNLTETKENTIRLVTVSSGAGLLSHVRFEPIN